MLTTRTHAGLDLPSVGIGTWAIGGPYWTDGDPTGWSGPLDDVDSVAGLVAAVAGGLNHIDTADVYGHGRSERLVGQATSELGESVTIASKVGFVATSSPSVYSPENIRFQLQQSLRNLDRSFVDLYYFHHTEPFEGAEVAILSDAVATVRDLKAEGLIREVGLSGYSASGLMAVADALKPAFIQSWASIEHPEMIAEGGDLCTYMKANDIRFVAMMPFGQGRLLGKYSRDDPPKFGAGDNRSDNFEFEAASLAQIEPKIAALRDRFGARPEDLMVPSLGYLLQHDVVITVIPGYRSSAQVTGILEATKREYTEDDHEFVTSLFPPAEALPHPWA